MTLKPAAPAPDAPGLIQFPDPPPEELTAYHKVNFPGSPGFLALHFGRPESTVILSEIAAALIPTESWEGVRYPDLLIAFDANPDAIIPRNGYLIPEQGKPPEFVLEVASERTGERDETCKRRDYASMGVPEYWRFDHTGGRFHSTHLAGDRLVNGEYRPIAIHRTGEEHYWGHSEMLNLDLCWERGELRWYDPAAGRYLSTIPEEAIARAEAEARAEDAEAQRAAAEAQRAAAEARVRELETQLRRQQNPGSP